jgi:hypothetical protein
MLWQLPCAKCGMRLTDSWLAQQTANHSSARYASLGANNSPILVDVVLELVVPLRLVVSVLQVTA